MWGKGKRTVEDKEETSSKVYMAKHRRVWGIGSQVHQVGCPAGYAWRETTETDIDAGPYFGRLQLSA